MIPNSLPSYAFIRLSVWTLRAVAPASVVYRVARALLGRGLLSWPLEVLALAEALFYFGVSLPRQCMLNRSRPEPVQRSPQERQELFDRCWSSIPDKESFLRVYFRGAGLDHIHRDDLKDFLAWGFLYQTKASPVDDHELEAYVRQIEETLGRTFPSGRGLCRAFQVSTDALQVQHKPLLFYVVSQANAHDPTSLRRGLTRVQFAVGADDIMTYSMARYIGLQHHRLPLRYFFTVFPFRPHTLFTKHKSPSDRIAYWYRPHTSATRLPVLFIHGIGVGMRTYTGFLRDFVQADAAGDGQTGIIAIELMPISIRITKGMPPRSELLAEILKILQHHGWGRFTLMGHSYGTIIATHILQHLQGTGRVGPMLLVDPVTLSIHWGGIPYNFLYRLPRKASEWQLQYFASTDMCVAHTITRRFDWTNNVLWKDDMKGRTITIALASEDIILDPFALHDYLLSDDELAARSHKPRDLLRNHHSSGLDVVWFDGINHSEMFDKAEHWQPLVTVLHSYCRMLK